VNDRWLGRKLQPFEVERLLAAFAMESGLLPHGAFRVSDLAALPSALRALVSRAAAHAWVCFSREEAYWLFTGVVSRALSRLRNAPVLLINSYREHGMPVELGAWAARSDGTWQRLA
jgi:hypothetical protein